MHKLCTTCLFHREFQLSLTQRLARDFGAIEGQLKNELTKMMPEEQHKGDAEASQLRQLAREEDREWRIQPEMTSYCGLEENKNVYYVATLKNKGGNCTDHHPAEPPKTCETCRHRVPGDGSARDEAEIAMRIQVGVNAAALGQAGGVASLNDVTNDVVMKKIFEATQAFYFRRLTDRPSYLPYCKKHSNTTSFVPCAVQNPHDTCADWRELASAHSALPTDGWKLLRTPGQRGKK
jgi:hypothetical protein